VFDLSLSGNTPGIPLAPPLLGPIPLNPPLLNQTLGPIFPGLFQGFQGLLDGNGQASMAFNMPNLPSMVGATLSAAGISLDPQGTFGLGLVSNGVQTVLGPRPSLNPTLGPVAGGAPVTVTGSAFTEGATVTIGGNPATGVVFVDSQTLTLTTPTGVLGAADLTVTLPSGLSVTTANAYTYIPNLSLTSVTPLAAAPGATITLSGDGFMLGATLDIGGVPATPLQVTQTEMTLAMPVGIVCDTQITVTNPSSQSASIPFNPTPVISQIFGQMGPASGGGQLTVTGAGFSPGTTLSVGGNPATIIFMNEPFIVVSVPPGNPGPAAIAVTSPSGCSAICISPGGCTYLYQ